MEVFASLSGWTRRCLDTQVGAEVGMENRWQGKLPQEGEGILLRRISHVGTEDISMDLSQIHW